MTGRVRKIPHRHEIFRAAMPAEMSVQQRSRAIAASTVWNSSCSGECIHIERTRMDTSLFGLLAIALFGIPMFVNTAILMFLALHHQPDSSTSASGARNASSYQPMIILTSRAAQKASAPLGADSSLAA
jgi:hypothetical protein